MMKIQHVKKLWLFCILFTAQLPLYAQQAAPDIKKTDGEWFPSIYGANDEIGVLNLLSPETVLQAIKLVRTGKTYPLAVPIDEKLPAFRHRSFNLYNIQPGQ
jgi:hypothetical protein